MAVEKDNREMIIEVNDVYKSFRVYFDKGSMLKEQFVNPGRSRFEEREILKGISFKVYRGETVALIGQNGCGKSTTLKMLTKILYPNKGTVTVNGKVSSLIELGAGFHPDMSGRENIYINSSILGIKKEEVDKRIDEIIRFSELEEFIDNPIRTYSSGMYMRLAFSVAINVDADILLIDEILAVGDQAFQEKCIRKLDELRSGGVTIVLVSHSMGQIKEIADRCIWIEKGKIVEDGDTETVCGHYEEAMERRRDERDELEEKLRREEQEREQAAGDEVFADETVALTDKQLLKLERRQKREQELSEIKARQKAFSEKWAGGGSQGKTMCGMAMIVLMILLTATSDVFTIGNEDMWKLTPVMWVIGNLFMVLGRISVPMMLILFGFELLPLDYSSRDLRVSYYLKKFLPVFGIWAIWVIIYNLFLHFLYGIGFNVISVIRQIMLAEYVGMSHAWVMRFIIIFMFITPYLANVLQLFSVGTLRFGMIIVWVLIFLFPGLDLYGQANGGEMSFPQSLGTFCYFYYFCLGFYISRYMRRIQKGSRELTIFVLAYLVTVWSQLFLTSRGVDYLIKPTYFGISLMALFGFDLLARVKVDEMYPSVSRLFKLMFECTAAMFFLYRPVQMLIQRYLINVNGNYETMELVGESVISMALKTVVLWVMTYVVTFVIAMTWRWGVKMVKESPTVG